MLVRNSISKAKKLLSSTIQSFKNMLSGGYERLPKTPPFNPFSCGGDSSIHHSFRELDNFYEEFNGRWAADQQSQTKKKKKKDETTLPTKEEVKFAKEKDNGSSGNFTKLANKNPRQLKREVDQKRGRRIVAEEAEAEMASHNLRVETCSIVARRLKELELMDLNDVDHVLDIEEVLHYYSRITSPFYVDIVNHFFMEIYAEFVIPQTSPSAGYISRHISYL